MPATNSCFKFGTSNNCIWTYSRCQPWDMSQQLLVEYDDEIVDAKLLNKNPETAMKVLIAQQSNGKFNPDMLHLIIRSIMNENNNNLKRLLYYFFEGLDKTDKSFMICMNQVNKDLNSPNEFVRGFVLKFIAKLDDFEYVSLLLKGVRDNLNHSNSYVRMNALFCLGELGARFDLDVEQDITHLMKKESSPETLIIGFNAMHKLGMNFEDFLETTYPKDVLQALADKTDDIQFLRKLLESKFNPVAFIASCKLLSKQIDTSNCLENILRILDESPDFKQDFVPYLRFVEGYAIELLNLIDSYEPDFSDKLIDTCFKNADTQNFRKIAEFLYQKYVECGVGSGKKRSFKILLLDKMAVFSSTHCVYVEDLISICLKNVLVEDPELEYSSLMFLKSCITKEKNRDHIHSFLIENFTKLKYGKIIPMVFDILSDNIRKEHFEHLLDILLRDLSTESQCFPFYLSTVPEVYVGAYICVCITTMYKNDWDIKAKVLGVLLKFIEQGTMNNILDQSSKSTITVCVRAILNDNVSEHIESSAFIEYSHVDVLRPIEFSMIRPSVAFKKFQWEDPQSLRQLIVQLSGLGDPLYMEANVTYSKYEMILDMLIINQTSSYLQDISLDFSFSKNLQIVTKVPSFSLQPSSANTIKIQLSILESLSSFITATASFKYPKKEDYGGKPFVQNLDEIKMDINEFLEGATVNFQESWKTLEWENIYSITIRKCSENILDKLVKKLNGKLCDRLSNFGFTLANIACYTIQKTLILINVCISTSETSLIEIRVRSKDEEIVKSVSNLASQYLRSLQ